jgi:hypothetical protein
LVFKMTKSIKEKRRLKIIKDCHALNKPVPIECIKLKISYNPYSSLNANQKVVNKILPSKEPYFQNSSKFMREYLGVAFRDKIIPLMHNIANSMKVYNFKLNISYYGSDEEGYISFYINLINKHGNPIGIIYLNNEFSTIFRYSAQYSNEPDLPIKGTLSDYADSLSALFTEQLTLKKILNVNPLNNKIRNGIKIPNKKHQDLIEKIHKYRTFFYKKILHKKDRLNMHLIYADKATWHISSRASKYQNKDSKLLESFNEVEFIKSLIIVDELKSSLEFEDLLMSNIQNVEETIKMENY